jgi:uncharacterized protein YqgC (DUF456 family)
VDPAVLWIAVALLVAFGLVGVVLPGLPGIPLVLVGLVVGAWIDDFAYVGRGTLVVLALLALVATGADFAATALGAKRAGAHRRAVIGAALGTLAGIFFGLPGLLLGPFAGAAIGEFTARGDAARAGRVGLATWAGILLGGAAKLAIAISMIAIFALQRFA